MTAGPGCVERGPSVAKGGDGAEHAMGWDGGDVSASAGARGGRLFQKARAGLDC